MAIDHKLIEAPASALRRTPLSLPLQHDSRYLNYQVGRCTNEEWIEVDPRCRGYACRPRSGSRLMNAWQNAERQLQPLGSRTVERL